MATNYNKDHHNATPHYNGNISALTTDYLRTEITPLAKFFRYDKLNRIKGMRTSAEVGNPQCHPSFAYSTYYTYDYNGNLDTLIRYDNETNELHYIEYEYLSGNNRLDSITAWWGLNTCGYRYDAIGNLTQDTGVGLEISWNAAGKVDTIWKNDSVLSTFSYSATGQRQIKKTGKITDYYIHDASGNIMCIYRQSLYSLETIERPIYGNKRLGIIRQPVDLFSSGDSFIPNSTIGMRQYELTDHLGNVMATILDRRQPYSTGDSTYKPYVISTTDYYPFGYPISNRSTNIGGYRYFFNGQEGDNEVFGIGGFQNYGFRMYDTRIARFWSVDPMTKDFPMLSPFQFASNTPIWGVDIDGLEVRVYVETPQYLMGNVGHVFLSVGTADDIIVYSYGRYGELEKDKGPLNFTNRRGEGVLNRLTGNTAASYIKKNLSKNNVSVFEIKDASEDVVQESFDQIFYNYGKASSSERLKNNPEARVIDQYDLFNNNCTTKTIDALIEGGSKESFKIMELIYAPSTYFGLGTTYIYENMVNTPEEMFRYLLRHATEEDNVKIITKDMKNEYQKSSD